MEENVISVKVNGGTIIARRNSNPDYDGIYIAFETDSGETVDIVMTEYKAESNAIDVYAYEDVNTEAWTRKFSLKIEKILEAVKED